jgi:hypothetical protein
MLQNFHKCERILWELTRNTIVLIISVLCTKFTISALCVVFGWHCLRTFQTGVHPSALHSQPSGVSTQSGGRMHLLIFAVRD